MRLEIVDVAPALAAAWLEQNDRNRRVSPSLIAEITNAMLNGKFPLTHQPIAITSDGRLLDGQHRLIAVINSGRTVPMIVAFDADPATFDVIDAGKKRTLADVMYVDHGHPFQAANVAACRIVAIYDRVDVGETTPWSARIFELLKLDRSTIAEITDDLTDAMAETIAMIKSFDRSFRLIASFTAAIHVIRRDTGTTEADVLSFVAGVITGADLAAGDVRLRLRDQVLGNRTGVTFRATTDARIGFMVTIRAWNSFVRRQPVAQLLMRRSMPNVAPI